MTLPTSLNYPIIAIADLHGQLDQLKRLVTRLEMVSVSVPQGVETGRMNQSCEKYPTPAISPVSSGP